MSRKSREDKSTWEIPSIEVFNADYGPFRAKGYNPIDNALVWFHYSTKSKDGRHPLHSLAGMVQELLFQPDVRFDTIICIDLKKMFESESHYENALEKEIDEVDLTKGFGKTLLRILQRMLLRNAIIAGQKTFCTVLIKLFKEIYFIDPNLISELWLLHPEISSKFVNMHLVSENDDVQRFSATKVTMILEKKTKNNRVKVLRCFFPTLEKLFISTPNNWFSIIAYSKDHPSLPEPYDPELVNNMGKNLFMSNMQIEMNRYSKQYERNCENTTSDLMQIISDTPDDDVTDLSSLNWSTCERQIGALVLRGNRCILVRSLEKKWEGMRIPSVFPMPGESPYDAAIRAMVELADVDASEVHILPHVLPIPIYAPDGKPVIVEIYPLYANNPPPEIPVEEADLEDEDDMYDWYTFPKALDKLDVASKPALRAMSHCLIQAAHVGLVPVKWGGVFGQELN